MTGRIHKELTEQIMGALIEVHREPAPGLLESDYEECLRCELSRRNIPFQRQVPTPVRYKTMRLKCGSVADMIVEEKVLLELKSVDAIHQLHEAEHKTYLKLTGIRVGLLADFNTHVINEGLVRRVI